MRNLSKVKPFSNPIKMVFPSVVKVCTLNCAGDSQFCINAGYEASGSGFIVQIQANGSVPFGHDISTALRGNFEICPTEGIRIKGIKLTLYDDGKITSEIPGSEV